MPEVFISIYGFKRGHLLHVDRRRLKRNTFILLTDKLNENNVLSANISRELTNSRISSLPIDMSRPSKDPF